MNYAILFIFCILYKTTEASAQCPAKCTCFKRQIDCSKRGLRAFPTKIQKGIVHLDLSGNLLSTISESDVAHLRRLETLDLSDNSIQEIDVAASSRLQKLTVLSLRKNLLISVPKFLQKLDNLIRLDLRANNITSISTSDIALLAGIQQVDLSRNSIREWASIDGEEGEAGQPMPLRTTLISKLDLSGNQITSLPDDAFRKFHTLVSLKLSRNGLQTVSSGTFRGLGSLAFLDLSRNNIGHLPSLLFSSLPSLSNLTLAKNEISRLDDGVFFGAERLLLLNLSNNAIQNISGGWLFGLQDLHALDLSSNSIGWFDPIVWQDAGGLRVLSLAGNRLRSLPSAAFRKLPLLHTLSLAENSIEVLHKTAMGGLDHLRSLDLSSNTLAVCVEDGAVLYNTSLPYLKELKFTNNNLKVVPTRAFDRFPALEVLDLRDNPIATIHSGAFEPLSLKTLYLNTSSLLCDCKLDWWTRWLYQSRLNRSLIETRCSHPSPLADIDVTVIDVANLTCMDDSPRPRVLMHPPPVLKTTVGADARLSCSGYGQEPVAMEWRVMEAGKARTLHEDHNTRITVNTTDIINGTRNGQEMVSGELLLLQAELADTAEYQCIVRNQFGTDYSHRTLLEVHQAPAFVIEPDDVALLVGQNARIACAATGVPQPVIKWQKDGGDSFPAASERRLHVRPNDDHLYVVAVKAEDAGVYTCHASNAAGHRQAAATVRVYENSFRHPLSDVSVQEGETVLLDCMAGLVEGQHVEWVREAEGGGTIPVTPTPRLTLKANQQLLIIVKAVPSDSGVYSCQLWAGAHLLARQSARVQVHPEPPVPAEMLSVREGGLDAGTEGRILLFGLSLVLIGFLIAFAVSALLFFRRSAPPPRARSYNGNEYSSVVVKHI